jgi:tripartite-type tricarboxylate transporter receptor subunit TctC
VVGGLEALADSAARLAVTHVIIALPEATHRERRHIVDLCRSCNLKVLTIPSFDDLMSGKVHVLFDNLPGSINFAREGKLKALGVTTAKRWDSTPEIPAISETVKDYEASVWYGISAPKGTPPDAVDKLNKAVNAALADPAMVKRFAELGAVPMPMSPAEFGKLVADETVKWKKVVEFAGISVE